MNHGRPSLKSKFATVYEAILKVSVTSIFITPLFRNNYRSIIIIVSIFREVNQEWV